MQLRRTTHGSGWRSATAALALAVVIAAVGQEAKAQTSQGTGYIESVTGSAAAGWACIPGEDTAANVAVYAGSHRVGIYPTTVARPDTQAVCGKFAETVGFRIDLTPIVAQQFSYQSNLSFFALAPNAAPYLLPASDPSLIDPLPLPTGVLTGLSQAGVLNGLITNVSSSSQPVIDIFAGGPANSGGQLIGRANIAVQAGAASAAFTHTLPAGTLQALPTGYRPSLYATGSYGAGPATQLGSPAMPGAGFASLYANLMQTGSAAGITNTIYTHWLSGNYAFMGLTGSVGLVGNDPSFSEALLTVGFTSDSQLSCVQKNGTSPRSTPIFSRLAGIIMKSNDTVGDFLPVGITLPYGISMAGSKGTCLLLWISGGYPFLNPYAAKYTNTNARLSVMIAPPQPNAPITVAEGVGNEFVFPSGTNDNQSMVVSMRLKTQVQIDAIAGSVSAGGMSGAPGGSSLLPAPSGNWTASTRFYVFGVADCMALGLSYAPGNPYFTIALSKTPSAYTIPPDARLLLSVPLYGLDAIVSEQSFFQTFGNPNSPGATPIILQPGECLIAFHNVASPSGTLGGVLDFENQSTAYFHLVR